MGIESRFAENGTRVSSDMAGVPTFKVGERGRVTLQVIAEHLAVSTATVSLALRDSTLVADATRLRVQKMAREMGYSYNRSAASLRTARTNILGVGFHDITNPYFAELLTAIETTSAAHGKSILLGTYGESLERQDRALTTLREYRPDGMIVCPAAGTAHDAYDGLIAAGIPVVQVSREIEEVGLDFVGSDDARGTEIALAHLVTLGHRRIAFIGGTPAMSTGRKRHEAYRRGLLVHGLSVDEALIHADFGTRDTGFKGIQALLALPRPPTAALCFNDITAFGAMMGLAHAGRAAGRDFAIIGSDDVAEAALWFPPLTTVRNFQGDMGRNAADMLMRRIAEPSAAPKRIILEPQLVVRATTMAL
jgi:LacI family transcriptional regulator